MGHSAPDIDLEFLWRSGTRFNPQLHTFAATNAHWQQPQLSAATAEQKFVPRANASFSSMDMSWPGSNCFSSSQHRIPLGFWCKFVKWSTIKTLALT
jgi:hypothetical protein